MQELDNLGVNWENANKHRQALRLGKPYPDSELCPCCFNPIQKQPFSLWENPKQMQIFGFGFPIMYSFMKNSIILLLVTLCSYNVLSLFLALQQNFSWCHGQPSQSHHSHCQSSFVLLARVSSRVTAEEQIVRAVSFVIHLLVLMYIRDKLVKLDSYFDERNCSMQDFSLLVKNIPPQPNTTSKIKSYFNTITTHPMSIVDVILLPQYEHIEATRSEKRKLINKLRPLYKHKLEGQQKAHLQRQLKQINQKLSEQISSYKSASENDSALCHNAIVVLNTEEEKNECLEVFSHMYTLSKYKCFGREYGNMVMEEAPDPKSIIWENVALSPATRKLRMIVSYAASLMILAAVTGLFYILMHVLGLGLYYWVDKYNLLRVNSVQSHLSARYIQLALKFLDLTLLFKALGMLLFDYQLRNQVHISTIVMCFAGLVYVLLPIDSILAFLHDENFNLEEKEYRNASNQFMYTYRNLHPVYSA